MSEDLKKMFIEDSPQDVNNLVGAENLSDLVIQLQKLEDEVKDDEERLKLKKQKIDKISGVVIPEIMESMKLKTMKSLTKLLKKKPMIDRFLKLLSVEHHIHISS